MLRSRPARSLRSFASLAALTTLAVTGLACDPPAALEVDLPGGLPLADLPPVQRALLRATIAVSEGALNETDVGLADDTFKISGNFALQNVAAAGARTLTLRVYGRFDENAPEVLLGAVDTTLDVTPAQETRVAFAADAVFETCGAGADGRCSLLFDENRNARANIIDLLPIDKDGLGIDPSPQATFVEVSPSTLQFPSGIRLGTFARQVVVLENRGVHPMRVLRAEVVDGQGVSLSLFDPLGLQVTAPSRLLDESELAIEIQPTDEAFVAVSFAPVNSFLTTGAVQIVVQDTVTLVTQTTRAKIIGNADGALRPPSPDYVPPLAGPDVGGVPANAFPTGPLFSGLAITSADATATTGLAHAGGVILSENADGDIAMPTDAVFLVDVPAGHRFSTSLGGLASDVDLAVFDLNQATDSGFALACLTCFSSHAGASPESAELVNEGDATLSLAIVLGRVDLAPAVPAVAGALVEGADRVDFDLTAHVTKGPEFDDIVPVAPTDGALEGGIVVTLKGRGFDENALVTFADSTALDVIITNDADGNSTVSLTLPPGSLEVGKNPATIVVVNPSLEDGGDGQAATLPEGFTYQPPAPRITTVSPNLSPTTGSDLPVAIDGTFFSTRFGPPVVAFGDVLVDATFISAVRLLVVPPALPADAQGQPLTVVLTVANCLQPDVDAPDVRRLGAPSNAREFQFVVPVGEPPTITAITPDTGTIAGGDTITIEGSGFRTGAEVLLDGVAAITSEPTDGGTRMTATTPERASDGAVDVAVINEDGQSTTLADGFDYTIPPPTVESVFPNRAVLGGGTLLVVTGTGFRDGVRATFERGASVVPASTVTRVSATALLVLTPATTAGTSTLVIENVDGQQADTPDFEFFAAAGSAPAVVGLDPSTGDVGGGYQVTVFGDGFSGPSVVFGGVLLEGDALTLEEGAAGAFDRISFVAPQATTGLAGIVSVQVVNGDQQSDSTTFAYIVAPASPRIDRVEPPRVSSTEDTAIVLQGANLGDVVEVFAGGLIVPFAVRSSLEIEATVPASPEGSLSISVQTATGKVASTVVDVVGPPEVLSLSTTTLHAGVAGDRVLIFGQNLDTDTILAVDIGAQPANVLVVDESFLLLEVPALAEIDATRFTVNYQNGLVVQSPLLAARAPRVVFVQSSAPDGLGRITLSLFGDFLNADHLDEVRLISGTTLVPCTVQTKSESSIVCQNASSLFTAPHTVNLAYTGVFDGDESAVTFALPFSCTNAGCTAQ